MIWKVQKMGIVIQGWGFLWKITWGHPNTFYRTNRDYIEEQTICNKINFKKLKILNVMRESF